MSRKFEELVNETLTVEREIRALSGDKPSLRCFIAECLTRAGTDYGEVEEVKEKLAEPIFGQKSGCSAFIRDLSRQITNGRFPTPPEARRIGGLYFNQKDESVMELGGQPKRLFALWIISAELAYQQTPGVFGNVEDLEKHKARLVELEEKRKDLHKRIPTSWDNSDIVVGRITSDFAALITWRMAPDCPVGNRDVAENLIDYLMERDVKKSAKAA